MKQKSISILNAFRNKYYTDGNNTENGIVANALDDILPEYVKLKRENEQEVEHGKWDYGENISPCFCSECGQEADMIYAYYPHCGVKMDGGEKTDED